MRQQQQYSVTSLMWETLSDIVDDFSHSLPRHFCSLVKHCCAERDIKTLRGIELDMECSVDTSAFKRMYQITSFFKRAILLQDSKTEADLVEEAISSFVENQSRLRDASVSAPLHFGPAMSYARGLCHDILGEWSSDEHLSLCRHGSHAAVGVPLRLAKLDAKWKSLSGSSEHTCWFGHEYLRFHDNAREFFLESGVTPINIVRSLRMTFVPKSFKSVRSITPNTVLGALHSDGIGKMITRRLKSHGLDISSLQERHRDLARAGSVSGKLTTCDQSSASDNITFRLLELLLPSRWLSELSCGRLDSITLPDESTCTLQSFCTMGIGFTFPLQTLVFYALARGIDYQFNNGSGLVSCYGDDLILETTAYPFFRRLAVHLGLQINESKSFSSGEFRESCGGDYYRGVDVRPFQPKCAENDCLGRRAFESLLYRFINGLRRRWDDTEIESTLLNLAHRLSLLVKQPCVAPAYYAEDCAILVTSLQDSVASLFDLRLHRNRNNALIFSYLRSSTKEAKVDIESPFLWEFLQSSPAELRDCFRISFVDSVPVVSVPGTAGIKRHRSVTVDL